MGSLAQQRSTGSSLDSKVVNLPVKCNLLWAITMVGQCSGAGRLSSNANVVSVSDLASQDPSTKLAAQVAPPVPRSGRRELCSNGVGKTVSLGTSKCELCRLL